MVARQSRRHGQVPIIFHRADFVLNFNRGEEVAANCFVLFTLGLRQKRRVKSLTRRCLAASPLLRGYKNLENTGGVSYLSLRAADSVDKSLSREHLK